MTDNTTTAAPASTYTVSAEQPRHGADSALPWLYTRLGLRFDDAYDGADDRRHELAVLAVDAGRRLLDLHDRLADAHNALSHQHRRDTALAGQRTVKRTDPDLSAAGGSAFRVAELQGRVAELDHTLDMIARAFRMAWVQPEEQPAS
jgi:hypothetical protein